MLVQKASLIVLETEILSSWTELVTAQATTVQASSTAPPMCLNPELEASPLCHK